LKQIFGSKARDLLAGMVMGKVIEIEDHGPDHYGRKLVRIEVESQDVSAAMIAAGMPWHYTRYNKDGALAAAEQAARAARRGLWADKEPVPPWEWRATEKRR
jgi:micrococcal nuclease